MGLMLKRLSAAQRKLLRRRSGRRARTHTEPTEVTPEPVVYLPFADDFVLGTGWTASGTWQYDPAAGLNSAGWFANSAARGQDSTLQLNGLIDLTTVLSPTLTFQQRALLTTGDRVVVEVSVDGGQTWLPVSEETGAVSEWSQRSVDLSAVSGQIIALRFRLDTTGELPAHAQSACGGQCVGRAGGACDADRRAGERACSDHGNACDRNAAGGTADRGPN